MKNKVNPINIDFEFLLKSVPGYVYWKDRNSVYRGCNQNVANLIGLPTTSDIIGKTDFDLPWGNNLDIVNKARADDQHVITTGQSLTTEVYLNIRNEQGLETILRTEKVPLLDDEKNIIGVLGISIDISNEKHQEQQKLDQVVAQEKRHAEKILSAQEEIFSLLESAVSDVTGQTFFQRLPAQQYIDEMRNFFENIIQKMPGYVYLKDKNFKYLFCNEIASSELLGFSSPKEIIGKTDYDFGWDKELVDAYRKIDVEIVQTGQAKLGVEEVVYTSKQERLYLHVNKMPLFNKTGDVIGIIGISIDITAQKEAELRELKAQKEAEKLKLEMERERQQKELLELEKKSQQFLAEQQEKFKEIVEKAVHDINTPLQVISSGLNSCDELPEDKLTRLQKAINNVSKILNDLAKNYKIKIDSPLSKKESRQDLLIVELVVDVLDDKKFQYLKYPISFEFSATEAVKTAHIDAQSGQLRRALSNLINNAIDALPKNNGVINVELDASEDSISITIGDNGCGMTPEAVQRILKRISFTENKTNGHGVGLQQVWDALEYNRGTMKIESTVGKGTSFKLTFPRFVSTNWIAQEIVLYQDTILVILEDEKSLHETWSIYLGSILGRSRADKVKYFSEGLEALNFVNALTEEESKRVLLLADYELANQKRTGLDIIVSSKVANAMIITGHANDAGIRNAALKHKVALLPKQLIADIPIRLEKKPAKAA
jgi:two-component system, OmpR family, aerobic respiration control sensor histidine kinase ArcB